MKRQNMKKESTHIAKAPPVSAAPLAVAAVVIVCLASLALLRIALYGTPPRWGHLSVPFCWIAGAVALIATLLAIFLLLRLSRTWRNEQSIKMILEDIAATHSGQESLQLIGPCPTGPGMSEARKGWNRLLDAIDQLRLQSELTRAQAPLEDFRYGDSAMRTMALLDTLSDGVILADSSGRIVLANRSCEGKVARVRAEFIGRSVGDLFDDYGARQCLDKILDEKSQLNEVYFDISLEAAPRPSTDDGADSGADESDTAQQPLQSSPSVPPAVRPCRSSAGPTADATVLRVFCRRCDAGLPNSDIVLLVRDITQQVVSQASRDEFIAHISHEFRSPLTNIRAYAETLLSDMVLDANAQKEAFNVINEETSRLTRLVNDVLDLSNLESGALRLEKGEVFLARLIQQCVRDVSGMAGSKKIALQSNYHPKLPNIHADRDKLVVAINNILTNAIKYTPQDGTVFVETNCDDQFIYIKVTDTGIGIDAEDIDSVFDKFYRVDRPETADIPGSGLGLTTSKEIIALHGGCVNVASQLDKGTEMIIKLPLTETGPVLGPAQDR